MPKCVTCDQYFHPDYSVIVDEATTACKCVFCYIEKSEVTLEEENGKPACKVTKKEAIENYRIYISKLKDDEKVAKVLTGNAKSKFDI